MLHWLQVTLYGIGALVVFKACLAGVSWLGRQLKKIE